jgi:hypothetical protein
MAIELPFPSTATSGSPLTVPLIAAWIAIGVFQVLEAGGSADGSGVSVPGGGVVLDGGVPGEVTTGVVGGVTAFDEVGAVVEFSDAGELPDDCVSELPVPPPPQAASVTRMKISGTRTHLTVISTAFPGDADPS